MQNLMSTPKIVSDGVRIAPESRTTRKLPNYFRLADNPGAVQLHLTA